MIRNLASRLSVLAAMVALAVILFGSAGMVVQSAQALTSDIALFLQRGLQPVIGVGLGILDVVPTGALAVKVVIYFMAALVFIYWLGSRS
jgi:uncharacterized membrane protein